ncbi:hypothetical protein [Lysobacter silvisoli]|uniref:Uncharacterized protein n=1 Tax=Lysobacter silvisoli TaxID=2293254 RepID=A0A371K3S2_9GAMM|nr:hypothetical protein [Lysobacter silvisoli]RDZ28573.1 hypothetical protein DX914_05450 [Lysobacter silvisoli]
MNSERDHREQLERALDGLDHAVAAWLADPPERRVLEREFEIAVARILVHTGALDYDYVVGRIRHSILSLFEPRSPTLH